MTPDQPAFSKTGNRILDSLPPEDLKRLATSLQPAPLTLRQVIYKRQAPIDRVYFPTNGIVSAMIVMEDGSAIEVATIGKEGMTGLTAFVGGDSSPYELMVQIAGQALSLATEALRQEIERNGALRRLLIDYNTAYATQVSYAIACNGLHTVEKRCCRWLLMSQDRMSSNVVPLTHEFLSVMLGVRRASVTDVLAPLQERGMIRNERGKIEILDRARLIAHACECYQVVNEEFARLFGRA